MLSSCNFIKPWLNEERYNILITSVGRRSYMVQYFKEALGNSGEVHVSNSSTITPAFRLADKAVKSPLIYDKDYIPFLLNYCKENQIGALLPLFDIDIPVLASAKNLFLEIGCFPIVPDPDIAQICNDKLLSCEFINSIHLKAPRTFTSLKECLSAIELGDISFPITVKPRWGMGSIGIFFANNKDELLAARTIIKAQICSTYLRFESSREIEASILYQESLSGQEYGLDIYNDLSGNLKGLSLREKVSMRSGETDCAKIVMPNEEVINIATIISENTRHPGNMDLDLFKTDNGYYILEMNPRFGGGYPFSHAAGANLPLALVSWLQNKEPDKQLLTATILNTFHKDISIVEINSQEEE